MFRAALLIICQKVEATQVSISRLMDKPNVVCPYNGKLFITESEILIHAATWIEFKNSMLNEISQTWDKYYMILLIRGP